MQKRENPEASSERIVCKGFDLGRLDKAGKVELKRDVQAFCRSQALLNCGRNPLGFQPKSWIAGDASNTMSFAMRLPIATLAFGRNGLTNANAARHNTGGTEIIRRGLPSPSKIRPVISR